MEKWNYQNENTIPVEQGFPTCDMSCAIRARRWGHVVWINAGTSTCGSWSHFTCKPGLLCWSSPVLGGILLLQNKGKKAERQAVRIGTMVRSKLSLNIKRRITVPDAAKSRFLPTSAMNCTPLTLMLGLSDPPQRQAFLWAIRNCQHRQAEWKQLQQLINEKSWPMKTGMATTVLNPIPNSFFNRHALIWIQVGEKQVDWL